MLRFFSLVFICLFFVNFCRAADQKHHSPILPEGSLPSIKGPIEGPCVTRPIRLVVPEEFTKKSSLKDKIKFRKFVLELVKKCKNPYEKAHVIADYISSSYMRLVGLGDGIHDFSEVQESVSCLMPDKTKKPQVKETFSVKEWKDMPFSNCERDFISEVANSSPLVPFTKNQFAIGHLNSADFASLFLAMCKEANIKASVIKGFLKNPYLEKIDSCEKYSLQRHVWNYFIYNKKTVYVDVALMSRRCTYSMATPITFPKKGTMLSPDPCEKAPYSSKYFDFSYHSEDAPFLHIE